MLDQETESFNQTADAFEAQYGFRHNCKCAQDYTDGNVGEVTECFMGLVDDALRACEQMKTELETYRGLAAIALNQRDATENLPETTEDQ
jgi:hypothetical protein